MTATASVQVDPELKEQAQALFQSLDFDLTTAVNLFLREAIDFHGFPFAVRRYNEETEQAIRDARNGVGLLGPFNTVEEAMAALAEDEDDVQD